MIKKTTLGLAVAAFFVTGSVQALVVTDSFSNTMATTEINQNGDLDKFDASLGTLNSVTINFGVNSLSNSDLTNNATGSESFKFVSLLDYYIFINNTALAVPDYQLQTTLANTGDEGDANFADQITMASGDQRTLGPRSESASITEIVLTGAAMDDYIGVGETFNNTCITITGTAFTGGGGNIANNQTTTANCFGDVSYDYTAAATTPPPTTPPPTTPPPGVAEPASMALMGLGLLGLGGFARRRKQK